MKKIDTTHFKGRTHQVPVENIFSLDSAETYRCNIWRYDSGLSWLIIATWNSSGHDAYYLCFEGVLYFEGLVNWLGANFQVAPFDECKSLLANLKTWEAPQLEYMLSETLLFTVSLPNSQIKIIAHNIYLSIGMPLELIRNNS